MTYTGPYYAKSHSFTEFYFTAGYLIQTYSGFTYGFAFGIDQGIVNESLTLFIGGSF